MSKDVQDRRLISTIFVSKNVSKFILLVQNYSQMPLTDTALKALKPAANKYSRPDGQGLHIFVYPTGSLIWQFRYRFNGKANMVSFGSYPSVSLAEARAKRTKAREMLEKGVAPAEDIRDQKRKAQQDAVNTFEAVANEWHVLHNKNKSQRHKQRVQRWLDAYLLPTLGKRTVSAITAPMILDATAQLQREQKLETAHRVIQTAGQVFCYAIQKGFATYNSAPDLKGALPPPEVKNMAAMIEPKDVAKLLRSIDAYQGTLVVQCALKLAPLLFQRIGELRHMRWADIDLEKNEWRYLVSKTKTPHIVPLARQSLEIIETMRPYSGRGEFVLPGARTHERPMSENAINAALRNIGYDTQEEITGHGFRAIAQTLGEQELGFDPKHIERQLAHSVANPLGPAYERSQFLADRKIMMQRWADYLDELKTGAKVYSISLRSAEL